MRARFAHASSVIAARGLEGCAQSGAAAETTRVSRSALCVLVCLLLRCGLEAFRVFAQSLCFGTVPFGYTIYHMYFDELVARKTI